MELIKDYDCTIEYHRGKANVVADALSRKSRSGVSSLNTVRVTLLKEFKNSAASLKVTGTGTLLAHFQLRPKLVDEVIRKQITDPVINKLIEEVKAQQRVDFELRPDGVLLKQDRIYVPRDEEVKQAILEEAHSSAYAMHPGSTKMYKTLRKFY